MRNAPSKSTLHFFSWRYKAKKLFQFIILLFTFENLLASKTKQISNKNFTEQTVSEKSRNS